MLARAFETFKRETDRPTLIIVDSHIAYGAPTKQDTSAAHGEPLGEEEVRLTKRAYGWPEDAQFLVPDGVREHFADGHRRSAAARCARRGWSASRRYRDEHPELADQLLRMQRRELPDGWDADIPDVPARREGRGRPRGVRQGAERDRQARSRGCSAARPTSRRRPRRG